MPLSGTPVGFKCPSGIKQTFSDGGWVVWRGVDSRDRDICVGTNWHGYNVTAIRGIVRTSGYQAASLPYVRAAVATITNEPPGVVATCSARVTTVGTSANDAGNNNPILRDFAIKIAGTETLTTPAGTFKAILVEESYTNSAQILTASRNYSFSTMRWIDMDTGVLLQSRNVKWDGTSTQWTTTALEHVS
jgi:hypothetical protein